MKKKFYLKLTVILTIGMFITIALNAQKTISVNIPKDRTHIPNAWNTDYQNNDNFLPGDTLYVTIDEGTIEHAGGVLKHTKAGTIIIEGAGADKTIYTAKKDEQGHYEDIRVFNLKAENNPELELIIKNITFRGFGYDNAVTQGGFAFFQETSNKKVKFINVNFEECRGAFAIIAAKSVANDEFVFENCYFGNNYTHCFNPDNQRGMLWVRDGGKITIKNCTFMSNIAKVMNRNVEPPVDPNRKYGTVLEFEIQTPNRDLTVILEDNKIINNLVEAETPLDLVHPAISFHAIDLGYIDVHMKNNMIIENRRPGEANKDVDLLLKNLPDNVTFLTLENNTMNRILERTVSNDDPPVETIQDFEIEGIDANPEYTYTHPAIKFRMDGDLPMILKNEHGAKYVEYGIGVNVKNNKVSEAGLSVYPNPSDGLFKINLGREMNNTRYEVFNAIGSLVKSGVFTQDNPHLDLRGNSKGLYLLRTYGTSSGCLRLLIN